MPAIFPCTRLHCELHNDANCPLIQAILFNNRSGTTAASATFGMEDAV